MDPQLFLFLIFFFSPLVENDAFSQIKFALINMIDQSLHNFIKQTERGIYLSLESNSPIPLSHWFFRASHEF